MIEQEAIETHLVMSSVPALSVIVDRDGCVPKRCLDLGCGAGSWVLQAAKTWPECEVIGYDLVNIQMSLEYLLEDEKASTLNRVRWVHGNFLSGTLPFYDGEFDHINVRKIAWGVPEDKWDGIFAELHRVLKVGGTIECIEEDIIFPTLPRHYTQPFREKHKSPSIAKSMDRSSPSQDMGEISGGDPLSLQDHQHGHDHQLLESLFYAVFTKRSISLKPTSIVPSIFSTFFGKIQSPGNFNFVMPPVPQPRPLPEPMASRYHGDSLDRDENWNILRPSLSRIPSKASSTQLAVSDTRSNTSCSDETESTTETILADASVPEDPEADALYSVLVAKQSDITLPVLDSVSIGPALSTLIARHSREGRAMYLRKAVDNIVACQENMYEELLDRVTQNRDLEPFNWSSDEELRDIKGTRAKFDFLMARYTSDMRYRVALWNSLSNVGYEYPPREPLPRHQMEQEKWLQKAIGQAWKATSVADLVKPVRCVKLMSGYKTSAECPGLSII